MRRPLNISTEWIPGQRLRQLRRRLRPRQQRPPGTRGFQLRIRPLRLLSPLRRRRRSLLLLRRRRQQQLRTSGEFCLGSNNVLSKISLHGLPPLMGRKQGRKSVIFVRTNSRETFFRFLLMKTKFFLWFLFHMLSFISLIGPPNAQTN